MIAPMQTKAEHWCVQVYLSFIKTQTTPEPTGTQQALDASSPRAYGDSFGGAPLGQPGNVNGHIIRLAETAGEPGALTFNWDLYLFGAQSDAVASTINLSSLTAPTPTSPTARCGSACRARWATA